MFPKEENSSIPLNDLSETSELSVSAIGLDLSHNNDNKLLFSGRKPSNININFCDITYSVNSWSMNRFPFKREQKNILKGISGDFQAYELTGIIGPSGSGKSSLLDILSGYSVKYSGQVQHNGCMRSWHQLRRQSAYIMQDCSLQPLLTVREAMVVSAQLKLGRRHSLKQKLKIVNEILTTLELMQKTDSLTATLSGGEMKRLAIALELVNNPPVMFFDEPTSGLDYHTAKKCLSHLKQLAGLGYNIVCTLHQPSASMLDQLDHLFVIADGRCLYQGGSKALTSFLSDAGLSCPEHYNPADHVLEVSSGENSSYRDVLIEKISNGKNRDWRKTEKNCSSCEVPYSNNTAKVKENRQQLATFPTQFSVLLLRTIVRIHRDKFLTYFRVFLHCAVGILLGLFYYGIGSDAAYVFDNLNLLFFSIMFLMYTAFSSMIISFPLELPIIIREHFNRWYSLKSYYLATTIADTPIQMLCTLSYCVIVYMASMQPLEFFRFGLFLLMCTALTMLTQAIGVLVGSSLTITHGVIFGPLFIMPWLIFSGFFLHIADAPHNLQWLFHLSFFKYALEGVMQAIYGYDREKIPCSDDYCHFRLPDKFLKELDMKDTNYWFSLSVILALYLVVKICTYFVLRYQLSHKR